jgi:hypothetical protein
VDGNGDGPAAETPKPDTANRAPRPGAKPKKRGR